MPQPAPAGLALRHELARKAIHLQSVAVPAAYALGVPRLPLLILLVFLLATAIVVEVARYRSARVRAGFSRIFSPLLREHEHGAVSGATWLLLSFFIVLLLLPRQAAIAAMWAVSLGDASAALAGRWIGRHRLTKSRKTIEGSTACAAISFVGAWLVAGLPIGVSIGVGILAAAAEWPGRPLDDNLRIAAVVGGGILLWQLLFT
jgi:dolichol kinase